jgi:hypothetical protein
MKYWGVPLRLTDNLKLNGHPIYALYYHSEMYSSKLETGLSDFEIERFREKVKIAYTYLENPKKNSFGNNCEKEKLIIDLFGNLNLYNSSRE